MSKFRFLVFILLLLLSVSVYAQAEERVPVPENTISDTVEDSGTATIQAFPETSWIFIPVDGAGTPTGGQYYLPLEMFRKMYQSPTTHREEGNRYFFRSAIYTGTISASLTSRDLLVDTIRAVYEVEVRLPETKIRFPFHSAQVYLSPGATLLNGEPVQTFSEDGESVVNIARPGRYVLEFTLIPIITPQETGNRVPFRFGENSGNSGNSENSASEPLLLMNGFRFEIPVIPSSRLELLVPASLNSLEFPTALGAQNFDQTARKWTVQLGNASALAVQWKAPALRGSGNGALMVDELYSWELGNENRTLHCRYRFRAREGSCSRMEWSLDPSLDFDAEKVEIFLWKEYAVAPYHEILLTDQPLRQLVPYVGKKEILSRIEGNNRRVTLTLTEAVQEPILVRFSLMSAGAGNAGNYVLPSIRTEKTRVMRRWFQIAGESNCQLSLTEPKNGLNGGIPMVAIQEFASAWEEFTPVTSPEIPSASIIPAFVLDDTTGASQSQLWVIHSQPLPAISTVQETLAYGFDKDMVHVNYTIQFPSTESIPALFHLKIPENLNVEKILLHDTQQKNLRYSRNHLTEVAIFYDRYGDSGETGNAEATVTSTGNRTGCKIEITGTMELAGPVDGEEVRIPFPKIRILRGALYSTSRVIRFYRTPSVLVTNHLENEAGELLTSETLVEGEPLFLFENVRWVATFSVEPQEEIRGFLVVRPNQPEIGMNCRTFLKMPREKNEKAEKENVLEAENGENLGKNAEKEIVAETESITENNAENIAENSGKTENGDMLWSSSSRWEMSLEMLLTVENGLADEMVLEIPSDLTTGFTLEPRMEYHLETISGVENTDEKPTEGERLNGNTEETSLKKFTQETLNGEWSRVTIRPKTPFSGKVVLRLNTELQDNRLDSSTRTALVRLPIVRFPGVTMKSHDVILPVLATEEMRNRYRWAIEGMLPVQVSRFELPENKPMAVSSEENFTESLPILPEWRTGNGVRICHIFDKRYTAQLLAQSRNMTNPTVESAIYSAFWNPEKELLGVSVFDVYPQKSPTCILRIPQEMEILEMHLDSRPVQVEEVCWSRKDGEFLPITEEGKTENEYRFYRITLRSLQLPQRLEALFHCAIPDWRGNRRLTLSPPFRALDRLYHLEFPVIIRQQDGTYAPIKAKNGAAFFYTGTEMPMSFWTKADDGRATNENLPKNSTGGGEKDASTTENPPTESVNHGMSISENGKSETQTKTEVKSEGKSVTDFPGYENISDFKAMTARPWCRIQLVCLERLLAMTTQVSAFQPTGPESRDELRHWFETWNVLRFGNERLVQLSLESEIGTGTENKAELVQNFEQLKMDGTRIFARQLGENETQSATVQARMEQLRQNSLWLVFLRNISHDCADCRIAFETEGAYDFYITETYSERSCRLPYLWQALFSLVFTWMIALGIRFHPSIPEEVRTLPFWLLCIGTLCILCEVNFWLSTTFLVAAVLSLVYRIGKLTRD